MNAWGLNSQRAMLNSGSVINILPLDLVASTGSTCEILEARKRAPKSAVSSYPHPVDRRFHDNHSPGTKSKAKTK